MKLYISPFAPNGLRVQIFAQEKGIDLDTVTIGPDDKQDYLQVNPLGQVPALVLEDGTVITESLTICQYLDGVSGPPALFGEGTGQRTRIAMWERRAELLLFIPSVEYGHHTHPMFASFMTQYPDWARDMLPKSLRIFEPMAKQLERTEYLAGDALSAADLTAYLGYFGLVAYGAIEARQEPAIRVWSARMAERPSLAVLKQMAAFFEMKQLP